MATKVTALKKITTRAQAIRKSKPSMAWTECIKKASAELKKSGAVGDYGINKTKFVEKKPSLFAKKKTEKKPKLYAVDRSGNGEFKKITKIGSVGAINSDLKKKLSQAQSILANDRAMIAFNQHMVKHAETIDKPKWRIKLKAAQAKYKETEKSVSKLKKATK